MTDTIKISRELLERVCIGYPCRERSDARDELRALLSTPPSDAADMGGPEREEVEVVAYAVDHPEAGYKVYKQFSQWMNGGEWRCDSLMTVSQHLRILAQHRQQAGKLVEALRRGLGAGRGTSGRIILEADDEQAMREALSDWEKTNGN